MGMFGKPQDQQDKRRYMKLVDQHGREWGANIELKTGDPTGTIDPKFKAPIYPPARYLKVDSRREYGRVTIDYTGWAGMLRRAWTHWNTQLQKKARQMYDAAAAEKLENPPPALLAEVGISPEPIEPVLAAEHGDPWVLGLTTERPPWADLFFPERPKKAADELPDELAFLNHGKEPEADGGPDTSQEFPVNYAPGRWELSDGSKMQGKKADAVAAQEALAVTHPSWGE